MFPLFVPRNFEIARTASVVESISSKVTVKKSARAWRVPKSSSSRNFEKFPFNRSCLLTIIQFAMLLKINSQFFNGALKLTKNFQEMTSNGGHYKKFTDLQTAVFSLACF